MQSKNSFVMPLKAQVFGRASERAGASTRNFLAKKYPCSRKPLPRKAFVFFVILFIFAILLMPALSASAADYVPLAPITGTLTPGANTTNLSTYLLGIFKVGIAVAGILAFLMIVLGGFQYLSTDAIMGKEEGKQRITRALGGLILALAAYIILYTINPNLVNLNLNFGGQTTPGRALGSPYSQALNDALAQIDQDAQNGSGVFQGTAQRKAAADAAKAALDNALASGAIDQATYDEGMAGVVASQAQASAAETYKKALNAMQVFRDSGIQNVEAGNRTNVADTLSYINSNAQTNITIIQNQATLDPNAAKDANGQTQYDRQIRGIQIEANAEQLAIAQAAIDSGKSVPWVIKTAMDTAYRNNNQNLLTALRAKCNTAGGISWCNSYDPAHP